MIIILCTVPCSAAKPYLWRSPLLHSALKIHRKSAMKCLYVICSVKTISTSKERLKSKIFLNLLHSIWLLHNDLKRGKIPFWQEKDLFAGLNQRLLKFFRVEESQWRRLSLWGNCATTQTHFGWLHDYLKD